MLEGPSTTVASMPVQLFLANDIVGANQELHVCVWKLQWFSVIFRNISKHRQTDNHDM